MEADKFQDPQLASCIPRAAAGIVPVWRQAGSRPRKSWHFGLIYRLVSSNARDKPLSQVEGGQAGEGSALLFYSSLQLIGWNQPILQRLTSFIHSTDADANLIQKKPHTHTENVWPNIWPPHGPVKLTGIVNHLSQWHWNCCILSEKKLLRHLKLFTEAKFTRSIYWRQEKERS